MRVLQDRLQSMIFSQSARSREVLLMIDAEGQQGDDWQTKENQRRFAPLRRLFEIYGPETAQRFRDLVEVRAWLIEATLHDLHEEMRPEEWIDRLNAAYASLVTAREELRTFIRVTFPATPLTTVYQTTISGGNVGNAGLNATVTLNTGSPLIPQSKKPWWNFSRRNGGGTTR